MRMASSSLDVLDHHLELRDEEKWNLWTMRHREVLKPILKGQFCNSSILLLIISTSIQRQK